MNTEKIDFVVTWVDGNDPEWLKEREKYITKTKDNSSKDNRFRDWNLMRYWFRGVEKFAPWVNHIYFVTFGHYPEWLNLNHPKLTVVTHEDYIPQELLPTFNSNTIEMYMHKIPGLSEEFVIFNDDMFLLNDTKPSDFFVHGFPCESALLGILSSLSFYDIFPHIVLNNMAILNKHFVKKDIINKYRSKFFSLKYGKYLIRNILLKPFVRFSDLYDLHLPSSHLKTVFQEVWEAEPEILYKSTSSRFRSKDDINHWLLKGWYICKGIFIPRSTKWGKKFELGTDKDACDYIMHQRGKAICINDSDDSINFERYNKELRNAFESILSEKSSFEI